MVAPASQGQEAVVAHAGACWRASAGADVSDFEWAVEGVQCDDPSALHEYSANGRDG